MKPLIRQICFFLQTTFQSNLLKTEEENFRHSSKFLNCYFFLLMAFFLPQLLTANNIEISNVTISSQNTMEDYRIVNFDVAWENSWRVNTGPSNWDAAWIFVKYRRKNTTIWKHATLNWVSGSGAADGHTVPTNAVISSSNDTGSGGAYGIFMHSGMDMAQSSVDYSGAELRWNYGVDGLPDNDRVEVKVFAIEMVYVPTGAFYVGSGGTESYSFYKFPDIGSVYQITSEDAITVGTGADNLYYEAYSVTAGGDQSGPIPATFPKGYAAFYCTKYEVTQSQYIAFLNTLTPDQAVAREYTNGIRDAITGSPGSYMTTNPYVPCASLDWADMAAYLDWAALRPMTELEFEKVCRGPLSAIPNEYAWGTPDIASVSYTFSNLGSDSESIASNYSSTVGNAAYQTTATSNQLRVGIFSAHPSNSSRVTAGAGYYGAMELSGNLEEVIISVGNSQGRSFVGDTGDGSIDASGNTDATSWPDVSTRIGIGKRGGGRANGQVVLRTSYRGEAARNAGSSGRGVRNATF